MVNQPLTEEEFARRVVQAIRETSWASMSKLEKMAAITTVQLEHPDWKYPEVAKALGTTTGAVAGVVFRMGMTRNHPAPRPIAANVNPVVKALFHVAKSNSINDQKLSRLSGYAMETIWALRMGNHGTRLQTLCDLAEAIGAEIIVRAKQ